MTIAIVSAKGGVGKSTVTSNVAAALSKEFGKRVLAIDGNITTPTLGIHVGILSQEKTLDDVLHGNMKLSQAVYIHPCGLHIVPSSLSPKIGYPDPEVLKEKVEDVKDAYDFIFIDGAAGIGREVISSIKAADEVLVVTNPDMASIVSAIKIIKIAKSLDAQVSGIILNKVTGGKFEIKKVDVESLCEVRVISEIPYDKRMIEGIKKMTPLVLNSPGSPAAKSFKSLAAYLAGMEYKEESNFFDRMLKKIIGVDRL